MSGEAGAPSAGLKSFLMAMALLAALLGYVREAAVAAFFGVSRSTDALYAALNVPFAAAHFLIGGALVPTLTAALAALLQKQEREEARGLLGVVVFRLLLFGTGLGAVIAWFRWPIARVLVPGFERADQNLTGDLLAQLVAFGVFTSLALIGGAALAAEGSYRAPVLGLFLGNLASVVFLRAFHSYGIRAAAWAIVAGSAVHCLALLPRLYAAGLLPKRSQTAVAFPFGTASLLALALAAASAVDFAERFFASSVGAGAVTLLAFSSKLVHLPMRLIAAPLASVAFPRLVRGRTKEDARALREAGDTANDVFLLLLYSAAVTVAAATPIVGLTLGRGRFDHQAVLRLAEVLAWLAPAVVAIGLIEIGSKYVLAAGRVRQVLAATTLGLLVYLGAALAFQGLGVRGLAAARSMAWSTTAVALVVPLMKRHREMALFANAPGSVLAAVAAAAVGFAAARQCPEPRMLRLLVAALASGLVFVSLRWLLSRSALASRVAPAP